MAVQLPAILEYGTVSGRLVVAAADTKLNVGSMPMAVAPTGTVRFRPSVKVQYVAGGVDGAILLVRSVLAYVDGDGVFRDADGNPGVSLIATDSAGLSRVDWRWVAEFTLSGADQLPPIPFQLPAGETIDLASVAPVDTAAGGIAVTRGPAGLTAYEVAVADGFVGTEAEWLASLVGPKGDTGDPGAPGVADDASIAAQVSDSASDTRAAINGLGAAGATPNTFASRDGLGNTAFNEVIVAQNPNPYNAVRKDYVDSLGTSTAEGDTVVRRTSAADVDFNHVYLVGQPLIDEHAAPKGYVDALGTPGSVADTIVRRSPGNGFSAGYVKADFPPTDPDDTTRKDYVDEIVRRPARTFSGAAHTLELTDENKLVYTNDAGPTTVTVPLNADVPFPLGAVVEVMATNTATSITPPAGVTIIGPDNSVGAKTIRSTFGVVRLRKYGTDSWMVEGDLNLALGTDVNNPDTVVRRDAYGFATLSGVVIADATNAAPSTATRRDYVDAGDAALDARLDTAEATLAAATGSNVANTLAKRDSSSNITSNRFFAAGATPTTATELTRKDYVDGKTWPATAISDSTATGRSVLTAASAAAARTATGAGVVDSTDGTVLNVVKMTQAAYDALGTKVATTLYVIVG